MAHEQPVQNSLKPGRWVNSSCKMCLHSCNTRVHITEDGIVNKIEGNPTSPSNNGRLCPKGNAAIMRHYDPTRFRTPLRRTNPDKGPGVDPRWEPISWNEAFDIVARELGRIRKEDPRRLLTSISNFQKGFLMAWPAAFGTANYFSSVGNFCGGGYHPMNGFIHSAFAAANDVNYCDYWINNGGGDGFSSHLHTAAQANHVANARVERNMRVVVVEPRLSIGAAKANEWVPIRPATDRQFALGLCHVLVYEKLYDAKFLKKDTNASYLVGPDGYFVRNAEGKIHVWDARDNRARLWDDPDLKELALEGTYRVDGIECRPAFQRFKDILADCTPQQTERVTTVPAATVQRIAREFAKAARIGSFIEIEGCLLPLRPAAYNYYRGAQGHKFSAMANHSFKLVNFLVGAIDAPGGHVGVTLDDWKEDIRGGTGEIRPGENGMMQAAPHQLHPEVPFSYPPNETHLAGYFPLGVDPGHLSQYTLARPEAFGLDYRPEALLMCHANPLWNLPGSRQRLYDIMRSLRFVVAVDILPNESNEWADIILPCHDLLESWNMIMIEPPHHEGPCLRQPATPPLYDTRSEEEIFYEISERLGILEAWNGILNGWNGFHLEPELMLEPGRRYTDREIAERKGLLWNGKDLEWYIEHGHAVTPRRPEKWYRPWEGMRLHFYLEDIVRVRDELMRNMEAADVAIRHEWEWYDYQPLPTPALDPVHEEPPEFDLYAVTFKDIQINFGETLSNPWIDDIVFKDPVHTAVLLNSATGRGKGLADGDVIRIESPYGSVVGRVALSQGVHPEAVCISNALTRIATQHTGMRHGGGSFNDLLPANLRHTDACSGQPETVAKVRLTKLASLPAEVVAGNSAYRPRRVH
ncbi:MAG: molybdopterin-dependent oxidoreductase [Burkholderiales bacterium]|nr:molybdopterin-dependent oxidoreductase [Burkholderiales bacterium]OJX08343.1 MAG: molybdopterin oxidoreductase, molybdopterin binding subunit [Burkholderiales bacterium 70-64]